MKYKPGILDAKVDIKRSLMATYGPLGFREKTFKYFLNAALEIIFSMKLNKEKKYFLNSQLKKVYNTELPADKRREDLLLIASTV